MLFFATGSSGSGKTACLPALARLLPTLAIHDFDEVGVPSHPDIHWRQATTEHWIQTYCERYQSTGQPVLISGGAVFGEIHAAPSINVVDAWHACLLDCDDVVRVDRLRQRGTYGPNMDILCWAAWLRVHAVDPTWCPEVIQTNSHPMMRWDRMARYTRGDPQWSQQRIDTSRLTIDETAAVIARWIQELSR